MHLKYAEMLSYCTLIAAFFKEIIRHYILIQTL